MTKTYTLVLDYQEGDFLVSVDTNYFFKATDLTEANVLGEKVHGQIDEYFQKVYYDASKDDMVLEIEENNLFKNPSVSKYEYYDESKGDYLTLDLENGEKLYPVANPDCFCNVEQARFSELLKNKYEDYFKEERKNTLTFGSLSYGVVESK